MDSCSKQLNVSSFNKLRSRVLILLMADAPLSLQAFDTGAVRQTSAIKDMRGCSCYGDDISTIVILKINVLQITVEVAEAVTVEVAFDIPVKEIITAVLLEQTGVTQSLSEGSEFYKMIISMNLM